MAKDAAWGCKALTLSQQKRSGRGDTGLLGSLLCHPVPALLLLPGAMTRRGPPRRGVGPARIATILHLRNDSSILGPGHSRRRGGHSSRRSRSAREGRNRRCKCGILQIGREHGITLAAMKVTALPTTATSAITSAAMVGATTAATATREVDGHCYLLDTKAKQCRRSVRPPLLSPP